MAIFDRLDRMASKALDRQFAVRASLTPMTKTANGRTMPDPMRSSLYLRGVFDQQPVTDGIEIGERDRTGNDLRTLRSGNRYEFSFDRFRFPYQDQIRQGDQLQLDDTRRFEVVSVERDGQSRAVLRLVQA